MAITFRIISAVLSIYMILIFVRILLTWFSGPTREGRAVQMLHQLTDPYLTWFRRFRFLQTGRIDFSPIAAVIVLVIVLNVTNTLAVGGSITLGLVLALIASAVGSAAFFVIGFFLLLTVIRTVSVFIGASSIHPFWQTLDTIINPVLSMIQRTLFRNRQLTYRNGLAASSAVLLAVFLVGRVLLNWFIRLLASIPF